MRHVFQTNEVAHIYAQQNQDTGTGGAMSFHKNIMKSYNQVIGNIQGDTIFLIDWNYSITTGKHNSYLKQATSQYNRVFIHTPAHPNSIDNFTDIKSSIDQTIVLLGRAKKPEIYINAIDALQNKCNILVDALKQCKLKTCKDTKQVIRSINKIDINSDLIEKAKKRNIAAKKKQDKLNNAKIKDFRAGETDYIHNMENEILRIKDGNIETSQGVKVALNKAKFLFEMYKKVLDGTLDKYKLIGQKIDYYKIDNVTDKLVTIGCHKLSKTELFNVLGKV